MIALSSMAVGTPAFTGQAAPMAAGRFSPETVALDEKRVAARLQLTISFSNQQTEIRKATERIATQFTQQFMAQTGSLEERFGEADLIEVFVTGAAYFIKMGYQDKIRVDITPENSLLLRAAKDGFHTYLETFFEPNTGQEPKTVLNIWKDKKQIVTQSGSLEDMIALHQEALNELTKQSNAAHQYKEWYHGVSGYYLTTTRV